jgi:hypothetical protein
MPTYNRPKFAERAILFWARTNINLVVLDGSRIPLDRRITEFLPNNIQYHNIQRSWTERILLGAQLSTTPYTALVNDDEFYLPGSLVNCVVELDKNKELVSVIGHVLKFKVVGKDVFFMRAYKDFSVADVSSNIPLERVTSHLNPYNMSSLFAICRTNVFLNNALVAHECSKLSLPASFELGFEIANSFQGKSKVIPILYWLRSTENPPLWPTKTISTAKLLQDILEGDDFKLIASNVQKILDHEMAKNDHILETILYIGLNSYLSHISNKRIKKWRMSFRAFIRIVQTSLRKTIRSLISDKSIYALHGWLSIHSKFFVPGVKWESIPNLLDLLQEEGIYVSENSLFEITQFITK